MWSAILSFLLSLAKWLWGGRQEVEGLAEGKATQDAANLRKTIEDAEAARKARDSVPHDPDGLADGVLRDPNNKGPG